MAPVLNRRRFLAFSGVGAVALAGAGYGIDALVSRAQTDPLPAGGRGAGDVDPLRLPRRPRRRPR
ncbi:MAG: twin-arginine translocation signal domain-containing protein [Pseudonocardiaceae bacterium]